MFRSIHRKVLAACAAAALVVLFGSVSVAGAATDYMLIDSARLASLPTSGTAYEYMKQTADNAMATMDLTEPASSASPWLTNYINPSTSTGKGSVTLAAALVYARTGDVRYRDFVIRVNRFVIGSEDSPSNDGTTSSNDWLLATMRQISGYVLAADLVRMDPNVTGSRSGYASTTWKTWLGELRTKPIGTNGYKTINSHDVRASNWGAWASAARTTIDVYLNDTADLAIAVARLKRWLGETTTGPSWVKTGAYDASWACIPPGATDFTPVNPSSCGPDKDGVLVEDASRSAYSFPTWDKAGIDYSFHAYMAQLVTAQVLDRQGYDVWSWGDRALKRIMDRLDRGGWATGNGRPAATHVSWIPRYFYNTAYPTVPARASETLGYTDWLYGSPAPTPTSAQPILGNQVAGTVWTGMTTNAKRASKFSFATPATASVTALKAYVDGGAATTGSQSARGVIYSDVSGAPRVPLATSTEVNISSGRAAGWITLTFASPVRLTAGTYWLALHSSGTSSVARYAATPVGGALRFNTGDAYADGASNPFGTAGMADKQMSIFAIGTTG